MNDVADAAQRARALDTAASFIVQAPAGSGKTELLTQRYLCLLAEVDHPEEVYAITFTRKAAAEMRNRVLAALDAAQSARPDQPHRRQTWELARRVLNRDHAGDWRLAANPNRLRIQTFDSMAASLARQLPLTSELGAVPKVTEQAATHYRDAARATLRMLDDRDLGDDLAQVLTHLDNRQAQLEDLLTALLARRDQWLAHALASPDGSAIEQALGAAVTDHLAHLRSTCPPDWLTRLQTIAAQAADQLGEPPPGALGTDWEALPAWRALTELLLTANATPRKSWNARQGFPAPSEKGIDGATKAQRQQAKAEIATLTARLAEAPDERALWAAVRTLPLHGPDARQQAVLTGLLQVLLHASAQLQLVFREQGEVDFAEIQMRAQRALGTPQAPSDLALSLDYRVRHLLIDEFQDTSSSQYRLLETLTAGWMPGDGRTLFAVGDPMQSIYRFREAEVGLYLAAREQGIGGLPLTPLTLSVNFRSSRAIVDWVNRGFPDVMPAATDVGRGAVPYAPAVAFDHGGDARAVQVHPFAGADTEAEARCVVDLVRAALTETTDGEVAVLARARSHLHAIAAALKDAGIGFQAVEVDPLAQRPVVQDLYHLTRALLHPADRLAWSVVLRTPWLGLDLPDLLTIGGDPDHCIPARLRDPGLRTALSSDGRRRVERLIALLDGQLPARGRRPLRQWIEGIWLRLGGLAAAGDAAADDAQAFLRLLDDCAEAGGLVDFTRLASALDGLYAAPDSHADGRVQLMTMHKAKGLEFDSVILPGLGRRPRGRDSELLYWLERPSADGRTQLLMAPIRAVGSDHEPISAYLRELERDKDRLETNRLLYVAATRARRRLHLLGHIVFDANGEPRAPQADSLLERLWPVVGAAFTGLAPGGGSVPPRVSTAPHAQLRLAADWQARLPPGEPPTAVPQPAGEVAGAIEFDWAGDSARHVGTLVHRLLQRIATEGIEHWPTQRAQELDTTLRSGLQNLGVAPAELDRALDKALRALQQTLADPTGRWILDDHAEARCEWPLTMFDGHPRHYVIDRSFVDHDGVRWIIDYKTGEHLAGDRAAFLDQEQARYRDQLENYARIVREIDPRPIRLALYFPLFADWRVWNYPE